MHVHLFASCITASNSSAHSLALLFSSAGFCLLNSVAIGAAYAKYNYRDEISRVAIVDFDVHNGDGTAAIVRGLKPHQVEH